MVKKNKLTFKQQLRAINEAVYDIQLTMNERKFYKWLSTQNKHKHLSYLYTKDWKVFIKLRYK